MTPAPVARWLDATDRDMRSIERDRNEGDDQRALFEPVTAERPE